MRTPISRIEVVTGAFVAAAAAVLAAALFAGARRSNVLDAFREGFVVTIAAPDAYGAAVGSPVRVRDVEVGSVTDVSLVRDGDAERPVRIRVRIQREAAGFLGDGTVAHVVRPPFGSGMPPFGASTIELRSGGAGALRSGATIPADAEESMVATFANMALDVHIMRERFVRTLDDLDGAMGNLRTIAGAIAQGKGVAGRMIQDPRTADEVEALLRDARAATSDLRKIAADGKIAAARAPALAAGAQETTEDLRKLLARTNATLDSVPRIVALAERTLATAEKLVENLRTASSGAPELARKVDVSLEETNRVVEAAQRSFLLRSTLPERPALRTQSEVRPQPFAPDAGAH